MKLPQNLNDELIATMYCQNLTKMYYIRFFIHLIYVKNEHLSQTIFFKLFIN
jgi:hypothetical protein